VQVTGSSPPAHLERHSKSVCDQIQTLHRALRVITFDIASKVEAHTHIGSIKRRVQKETKGERGEPKTLNTRDDAAGKQTSSN
jgi:hypothetical protein